MGDGPEFFEELGLNLKNYFLLATPTAFISQFVLFIVFIITRKNVIVDMGWAINHFLIGLVLATDLFKGFGHHPERNVVSFLMLTFWFLRLGGFLFYYRIFKAHSDKRYEGLTAGDSETKVILKYLFQYILQGMLVLITALPLRWSLDPIRTEISFTQIIGWIIIPIALGFELVADLQLQKYKDSGVRGGIFQEGLWKKSRHPNLFFELCVWFGITLTGINSPNHLVAFIGPIFLWAIMNFLTIPVTEEYMKKTRSQWPEYEESTNKFLPFL